MNLNLTEFEEISLVKKTLFSFLCASNSGTGVKELDVSQAEVACKLELLERTTTTGGNIPFQDRVRGYCRGDHALRCSHRVVTARCKVSVTVHQS